MEQTPIHQAHNPDLLKLMPTNARRVVEVGCSSGALAREYKRLNPNVHYIGIELVPAYAEAARAHCDEVMAFDIEAVDEYVLRSELAADCWVFGDVLEHLKDPWLLLRKIRAAMGDTGHIVTCIPNMQHWSVQARLSCGDVRYEDSGLFDRTHLRWFSRVTMLEMFTQSGFRVEDGMARIFDEPQRETFLPIIKAMATAAQADVNAAVQDALPLQYVLRAVPDVAARAA
ncbi:MULTISPECIES: class I SAM-dependent methyltransferase [Paraburkholderia]|jgi:SAM-dependent methyltransferase|uniref:Methyltransferase domain-containing protein n=1 Tax=Paraburkholderia phenazinium TaxID=60549 RepID=A0A1N6L7C7_9BURK|nr:class I SAM-dependent methyltransferase [Paraburkholderia phenazinium]SIO64699.1 Methyltransferase domain-containing protein [Paraburkholderia phenazinium]